MAHGKGRVRRPPAMYVPGGSVAHPGICHARGDLGTLAYLDNRGGVVSAEIGKLQCDPRSGEAWHR